MTDVKTLVVKIGTTLLSGAHGFDGRLLEPIVLDLIRLKHEKKMNILMVSSGAIGCGMNVLGIKERPKVLPLKQATAAVGQVTLMHYYETLFRVYGQGLKAAQVLLSAGDLDNRETYLNVTNTIMTLFDLGCVVPIVNENDSTATDELRFGDNDTLAAKIAAKIDADLLIVLSDIDGLYDQDPSANPTARLVEEVQAVTPEIEALAGDTRTQTSTGGMKTKLAAAKIVCSAGLAMVIANGHRPSVVRDVLAGTCPCTRFGRAETVLPHRKRWIAYGRKPRGVLVVDDGARRAIVENGKSLLPAGVVAVRGNFAVGDAVQVVDGTGREVAAGLVNYASVDIERIKGRKSDELEQVLGRRDFDEVIHRDNLVIL
ncbi:MAG TPA: glutamate 5-kinase [Candidatus Hydrogenedentes bacterium]|nr:glutamate 5-kinase [Candidatus Hydrogenedentota bacterium]HPG65798.1 glutamate 5-kinase [Candidatus Hydrogenedentota bacterium]